MVTLLGIELVAEEPLGVHHFLRFHDKESSLHLDHITLIEVIVLIFQTGDLTLLHLIDHEDFISVLSGVPHEVEAHRIYQKFHLNSTDGSSVEELVQILELQKLQRIQVRG